MSDLARVLMSFCLLIFLHLVGTLQVKKDLISSARKDNHIDLKNPEDAYASAANFKLERYPESRVRRLSLNYLRTLIERYPTQLAEKVKKIYFTRR